MLSQEATVPENVYEPQDIFLVGNTEIGTNFVTLQVFGIDADKDLYFIFDAVKHRDLVVWSESRKDTGGVHVVEKLAAHLQIELPAESFPPLPDVLGLHLDVFFAVEADPINHGTSS